MNNAKKFNRIYIGSHVSGFHGRTITRNEVSPSKKKRRARKVRSFGQVVLLSVPNVWRALWDGCGYKNCFETSLNYKGVRPCLATATNTDTGQVTTYSKNLCPNSD